MKNLWVAVGMLAFALSQEQARCASFDWTFSLIPSADISGPAGSTIGWGYQLVNEDPDNWLAPKFLDAGPFEHAFPFAIFDFPILAPLETVTVAYNFSLFQGLYELTWDPAPPPAFVNAGIFTITADWYDADPLAGGGILLMDDTRSADYTATLAPIPEPTAFSLATVGLGCVVWFGRRFRR
jgi:hypothetical protein